MGEKYCCGGCKTMTVLGVIEPRSFLRIAFWIEIGIPFERCSRLFVIHFFYTFITNLMTRFVHLLSLMELDSVFHYICVWSLLSYLNVCVEAQ